MVLLPDYPQRVINEHKLRVEKFALFGLLILVFGGGWWLWPAVQGEAELIARSGPVAALFISAILLSDLIDYGPVERTRVGVASNIAWPGIVAMAMVTFQRETPTQDSLISATILLAVSLALWNSSYPTFDHSISARRLRGLTSAVGLAFAIAVLANSEAEMTAWAVTIGLPLAYLIPDLLAKDEAHDERRQFSQAIEEAETRMMKLRTENSGLEQAASLIKNARDVGWQDPEKGFLLIEEAMRESERIIAMSVDLGDIREDSLSCVTSAEAVTTSAKGPRRAFDQGEREAELGSLREAEILYRIAKTKAQVVIDHWETAINSIREGEEAISEHTGQAADSVRGLLVAAREAMEAEEPLEAIQIASTIPGHLESLGSLEKEAARALKEAEQALSAVSDDISHDSHERLKESKAAFDSGDFSLSKGISESISRDIRGTSDSMKEVQRALRQRKQLESRFPNGGDWASRLQSVSDMADSGDWEGASESLGSLTKELRDFESERDDAQELLDFLNKEWGSMRKRLDSAGIAATDEGRARSERLLAEADGYLAEGDIQACLSSLGEADSEIEALRMRT
tara:strand:- start:20825 stop:22546 length:1722 start_codon:yes stop_codon:yes gene_type:complete